MTAFLDDAVGRAMYPDLLVATAAAATTTGQARRVPGGYRITGRFPFLSGCQQSEWAWLGCIVVEDGTTSCDANSVPKTRQCFARMSECEILDTWHTTGLRGTGSNDVAVHDVFVDEERSFSFQDPGLIKRSGPLYAFPFMFVAKGAAPALGISRSVIDAFVASAADKPARRYTIGEAIELPKAVREDVYVQEAVGRAETQLAAARAYYFDVMGDLWNTLVAGGTALRAADRAVHHHFYACRRRLRRRCAADLQGGRRNRRLSKGTFRPLLARRVDDEPARGRVVANLRNVRSAFPRPPAFAGFSEAQEPQPGSAREFNH